LKRRGLVIIFSDFFDDPESITNSLKHFRHKEHEVIVFQVLDPREIDFNFGFSANFIDLETSEEMITQPFQIKASYAKAMTEFRENLKKTCNESKIDYFLIDTSETFDKALRAYLSKRILKQ